METLLRERPMTAPGRSVTVGAVDSGRMVALRLGDRLAIDAPAVPGATWRLRGGAPLLEASVPHAGEPAFVLRAVQPGRTGVDLVAAGSAMPLPRPIRLIVTVGA
jgi:hypothetical protein